MVLYIWIDQEVSDQDHFRIVVSSTETINTVYIKNVLEIQSEDCAFK